MSEQTKPKLYTICPCFIVEDVVKTAEYYRDVLGFSFDRYWGEPPCFVIVDRDNIRLFFSSDGSKGRIRPNRVASAEFCWDAYIYCRDADALCQEFKSRGAEITRKPETTFYEMHEFELRDCNGYTLCFAHNTQHA